MIKEAEDREAVPKTENILNFTPWDGHLAIRPRHRGRTKGGIIIPDTAKDNAHLFFCDVFSVGPGCVRVKQGDTVVIHGGATVRKVKWDVMDDKLDFLVIKEDGILGTV